MSLQDLRQGELSSADRLLRPLPDLQEQPVAAGSPARGGGGQGLTGQDLQEDVHKGNQHRDDCYSNFKQGRKAKSSRMWDHVKEHHIGNTGQDHREDFQF